MLARTRFSKDKAQAPGLKGSMSTNAGCSRSWGFHPMGIFIRLLLFLLVLWLQRLLVLEWSVCSETYFSHKLCFKKDILVCHFAEPMIF